MWKHSEDVLLLWASTGGTCVAGEAWALLMGRPGWSHKCKGEIRGKCNDRKIEPGSLAKARWLNFAVIALGGLGERLKAKV